MHRICCLRILLLLTALGGCDRQPATGPAREIAAVVPETAMAEAAVDVPLGTVPATVSLPPAARVAVTAPFPGTVRQIHVIAGQEVRAGQVLATIVSREALSLASDRARARSKVELARANADRIGQLAAEGVVAAARADEARAALREAQVDEAEAARILSRGGASADGIVRLVAPIAGRVAHIAIETGGPLDGMTAPFVIDAANAYALDLQLPERLARKVRPGMEVVLPGGGRGTILSVAPGLDPTLRSVPAIARIGAAPGLLSGTSLLVTIIGAAEVGAVTVPSSAVTRHEGRDAVFVAEKGGFRPQSVVVAGAADGRTVIAEGLTPGARVAVSSLPELKSQAGN